MTPVSETQPFWKHPHVDVVANGLLSFLWEEQLRGNTDAPITSRDCVERRRQVRNRNNKQPSPPALITSAWWSKSTLITVYFLKSFCRGHLTNMFESVHVESSQIFWGHVWNGDGWPVLCCPAIHNSSGPSQNTISMTVTSPLLKTVAIATKLPESWPLMRTNKGGRVLYPGEDTSPCVHLESLAKRACFFWFSFSFSSFFSYVHKPETDWPLSICG